MVPTRNGPKGAEIASFGLAILVFALTPSQVGYQDLAALIAQQPAVAARWREHLIASPFGTIHAATFSLPRPVGTMIPESPMVRLASLSTGDVTGSLGIAPQLPRRSPPPQVVFPQIDRTLKGDRLVPGTPSQGEPASTEEAPAAGAKPAVVPARPKLADIDHTDSEIPDAQALVLAEIAREARRKTLPAAKPDEITAAMHVAPFPDYDVSLSLELDPKLDSKLPAEVPADLVDLDPTEFTPNAPPNLEGLNAEVKESRLYFGNDLFGTGLGGIRPWDSGEAPRMPADPEMKQAAAPAVAAPGVTVAGKGEVTGDDRRPRTPAERLALTGPKRAKAEKCLANAVYFESRSEPVRGQIAVAQVVVNRAFSGFYPNDVCGVVYQNAHRHLACQFTFACDGIADVVNDQDSWERAKRIAQETLDGKLWLPEIGKSTHYHASYVSPYWVRAMKKHAKIGLHHFYRPRRWGDGDEAPSWGNATYTADAAAKM
jgi:hypothetical protein